MPGTAWPDGYAWLPGSRAEREGFEPPGPL